MAIQDTEGNPIDISKVDDVQEQVIQPNIINPDAKTATEGAAPIDDQGGVPIDDEGAQEGVTDPDKPAFTPAKDDDPLQDVADDDIQNVEMETEVYTGLGTILEDSGVFGKGETPITSKEDLTARMEQEVASRVSDKNKKIEEYMTAGVAYETVNRIQSAIDEAEAITEQHLESNEGLVQSLIISGLVNKGISEEDAAGYYNMFKENGKHIQEANKALIERKQTLSSMFNSEIKKAADAKIALKEEKKKEAENLVKSLESGEILGRKITSPVVDRLKRTLNTVVGYTDKGEPLNAYMKYKLENPVEFERNILYLYTLTDGFKDLKALDRNAETRVSRKLKNAVVSLSASKSFADQSSTLNKTKIDIDTIDDIV